MDYTREQIVQEVYDIIGDTVIDQQLISKAPLHRALDRVVRNFVTETECNRNVIIVNVPDATSDGEIVYNMLGTDTVMSRVDMQGWNLYTIPSCLKTDGVNRWLTTSDGFPVELDYIDWNQVDIRALLFASGSVPANVQMFAKDKFRLMPGIEDAGYPFKLIIIYRLEETPMISNPDYPAADGTGQWQGGTLDDLTGDISKYTGSSADVFEVKITTAAIIDKFDWRKNGGAWTVDVNVTTSAQHLSDEVYVTLGAGTGHAVDDAWLIYTDDKTVPTIPKQFRQGLVHLTVGEIAPGGRIQDRQLAMDYLPRGMAILGKAAVEASMLLATRGKKISHRYTSAGF